MHPLFRPVLLTSLAVLAVAAPAAAQRLPSLSSVQLYGGLSLGPQQVPDELQSSCTPESFGALEARAGARSGAVALEVRGAVINQVGSQTLCLDQATPDPIFPPVPDGIYVGRVYGFDKVDPTATFDARLRFGGTHAVPVVASVGAGRMAGPGVSYLLASLGVRTRGKVRMAVDVERDWYHVEETVRAFEGGYPVSVLSREQKSAWWHGTGIRLGAEMDLF
jgi:hypothetical protein